MTTNRSWSDVCRSSGWVSKSTGSCFQTPVTRLSDVHCERCAHDILVLQQRVAEQRREIDTLLNSELALRDQVESQQRQINTLITRNERNDAINNVCNVLDMVFIDIVDCVNALIPVDYERQTAQMRFRDWKHLRQYISRERENYSYYESLLEQVLCERYGVSKREFERDITGLYGIKGGRNREIHPRTSRPTLMKLASHALSEEGGVLSMEAYSATTRQLIERLKCALLERPSPSPANKSTSNK